MKAKSRIWGILAVLLAFALAWTMVACDNSKGMYIDVPSEPVECELGEYTIEIPYVRDADGLVISDRTVTIKSAVFENGETLSVSSGNKVTVKEPAVVKITFGADGVKDAVMTLNFADRQAPTIELATSFPSMYFSGNSYAVPHYSANEALKSTSFKVDYYESSSATPESVTLSGYAFTVNRSSGFYRITISVEDEWGNSKDYTYDVPVGGVGEDVYEEGTIVYFENEFGLEQASDRFNNLGMEFVEADSLPEGMLDERHADIAGATKVWRDAGNPTGTETGEADIILTMPYITNLSDYDTISVDIYNPSSDRIAIQLAWGGGVVLKPNGWTRAAWDIEILKFVNIAGGTRADITGLVLCLASSETDASGLTQEGGETLYFANMKAVKNGATEYRIPQEDVKPDKIFYTDTPAGTDNFFLRDGNWNNYSVEFVEFGDTLPADTEGPAESEGMTKVTFSGISSSAGHLDTISSYITALSDYAYMAWRVYNPNDFAIQLSYHTGGADGNNSAPAATIPAKSFGTYYINFDYLDSYGYNRIMTRSANDIWLYVTGENGTSIDGASVYFGACYGIRYTDVEATIGFSDLEMDLGNVFNGGTYGLTVGDSAAAEWTHGDALGSVYYKLSSAILNGAERVTVTDGKFTLDTVGECEYELTYTAYMYTVSGGQVKEEIELSSVLENIKTSVTITVISAQDAGEIEGQFTLSKNAADGYKTITIPAAEVSGTFVKLTDENSDVIGAQAAVQGQDLVITLTEEGLQALGSGEITLQLVMLDNDTNNYYTLSATVWDMFISTPEEMLAFEEALNASMSEANALSGWYRLDSDIDLTDSDQVFGDFSGDPNKREGTRYFAGLFDGNGFSITGAKLGNKGMFNWVTASGVIRNVAIVDAYAYGWNAEGTQTEQNVSHGSNILAEGFYGTLENVYVSGSVGTSHWSYSGLVWQMRAEAVKDCIFDIELRKEATADIDTVLGAWITTGASSTKLIQNVVVITTASKVCNPEGGSSSATLPGSDVAVYANNAECYGGLDMAKFTSSLWTKDDSGIYFNGDMIISADALPVDLAGEYELSKTAADGMLSVELTDAGAIKGNFVAVKDVYGNEISAEYADGVLTFDAAGLANAADGETVLTIVTKDNGVNRFYKLNVTIWTAMISDADDLFAFQEQLNAATTEQNALTGWYRLTADIDLTDSDHVFGDFSGDPNKREGTRFFAGGFDGDGHSITGAKLGNKGMFNWVTASGVIRNVAIVDAYAYGWKENGTQTEQNVSHGSNILSEGFYGTLENVYVSGSIGTTHWSYSGLVWQMRAAAIKNCVFNISLRAQATGTYDSALGAWIAGAIKSVENLVVITSSDRVCCPDGGNYTATVPSDGAAVYTTNNACLEAIDISKFDAGIWSKTEAGILFGGKLVVAAQAEEVNMSGSYELSRAEKDGKLSFTLTGSDVVTGEVLSVTDACGTKIAFGYKDGTFTFTADALRDVLDGNNVFAVIAKDGDTVRRYNVNVTVWTNIISDAGELKAFDQAFVALGKGKLSSLWYKMDADVDMSGEDYVFGNIETTNTNNASQVRFAGVFDGQGHMIKGVKTGNGGLFGYVERAGVIRNLAVVDAYGQGTNNSVILGGGWFLGTLENVFVSGTIGDGSHQDGVFSQNRAKLMKNVVFDVELRSGAAGPLLGIWVPGETADALNSGVVENFFAITAASGSNAYSWAGEANTEIKLYADAEKCLAAEDFSGFDSVWEVKADGVYFGGNKVIDAGQTA